MYRLNSHNINLTKINKMSNFSVVKNNYFDLILKYKNIELDMLVKGFPIISRKLGYHIPLSELKQLNIMIMSAEENTKGQIYHNHYYFILKDISNNNEILVKIKYMDMPISCTRISNDNYINWFKSIVSKDYNYNLIARPKYEKEVEMILKPGGFAFRPIYNSGSFYFETKIKAETLGDLYLAVDSIVSSIENKIRNKILQTIIK